MRQGTSQYLPRISCLKSFCWSYDCRGQKLDDPVHQLVACYGGGKDGLKMLFRDDEPDPKQGGTRHRWVEANYTGTLKTIGEAYARAVIVHRDAITGIEKLHALSGLVGSAVGVYDPSSKNPGKVVWEGAERLELPGGAKELPHRPLAYASANGKLYMSSGGLVLQRVDGRDPFWRVVVDVTALRPQDGKVADAVGGIRGLTAVANPQGAGSSLLFCWNPNSTSRSWLLRADPSESGLQTPVEETAITELAKQYLGQNQLSYTLAAYNNMLETAVGSQTCNLIGFEVIAYGGAMAALPLDPKQTVAGKHGYWAGGGFVVRRSPTDYFVMEVGGPRGSKRDVEPVFTAVRCYQNSPFPEEPGVVYFGGYDCNSVPSEHTAWIYKGSLQ